MIYSKFWGKDGQLRILYLANFTFRMEGEVYSRQAKAKGVNHLETVPARNVKVNYLTETKMP